MTQPEAIAEEILDELHRLASRTFAQAHGADIGDVVRTPGRRGTIVALAEDDLARVVAMVVAKHHR